jgi:L-iditol 2-dehydrogenase
VQLGATAALLVRSDEAPEAVAERVTQAAGAQVDAVIDCAGYEPSMRAALRAARSGGCVVLVGMGQEEMALPVVEASMREIDILGSFRYCNTVSLGQ